MPCEMETAQSVIAAKPNPRNNPTMFKIFQNVQYNVVQHKKYVKEMVKLYKKLDEDSFRESFKNAMMYLFTFGDTSANVDRVIQFVSTFCTSLDDEEEFLLFIFEIIFNCQCVSGQSVRYRASQLLAAVLSALGDDASLDDDLCDKLLESQMARLQDTRGAVRCRAALALQRLQNPMEQDDMVTRSYRFHMSCDPSSSVRSLVFNDGFVSILHIIKAMNLEIGPNSYEMCLEIAHKQRIKLAERSLSDRVKEARIASRSSRKEMQEQEDNLEGQLYGAGIADKRAIVMSIAKCVRNVPFVLERLCDVDEAVRRAAFLYIAAINVTQLRVRQRLLTLKVGLTERSPRVRRVVEEILIPGWLSTFQGNIVDLLKAIRLDNAHDAKDSQYVAGKLLESLFKRLPISELLEWLPVDKKLRLIAAEKLNKETAWYWRHLAEHLQKIDDDETLETILPDLVVLTGYIRAIVESPCPDENKDPVGFSTRQYVLHELGTMLKVYDTTDPTGRTALQTLITDVLTGDYGPLNADVIRAFVEALELVVPDVSARIEVIAGVIDSLRDPPEPDIPLAPLPQVETNEIKMQRARLRVSLNVAIEAQEEAVREQNYSLAAECKAKVEDIQRKLEDLNLQPTAPPPIPATTVKEKACDSETLSKCLTILNCALDTPHLTAITPRMRMIFNEMEVDIFQNPEIIVSALETIALYGMLDKEFIIENKAFFFANLVDTSNEPVVSTVLRAIVDLLCVHGAGLFEDEHTQNDTTANTTRKRNTTHNTENTIDGEGSVSESVLSVSPADNTVMRLLLKIVDGTCPAYRLIVVEGLCKLLHLGHLESPAILSRLLLLWFNPATVDEDMLRQTIGVFFQTFPTSVDGAQEQIQKATLPTLRALVNAPASSPLAEIDQEAVVRFIVSLTRVNHELIDSQGGMATILCQYIVRRPTSAEVGLACRLLALLSPPRDAHLASELAHMLRDLCSKLPDKQSCRNLTRYLGSLEAAERASLNKISNTVVTEGTIQEDSLAPLGRITTSLPQPIGRSTHVVVNETVEEETEIDETSPPEDPGLSKIVEELPQAESSRAVRDSSENKEEDSGPTARSSDLPSDASSGVSPVKKAKISKGKKKLSMNRQKSKGSTKAAQDKEPSKQEAKEDSEKGGVKRSRSQRSLVDVERAQAKAEAKVAGTSQIKVEIPPPKTNTKSKNKPSPPKELSSPLSDSDVSNVTIRRSTRGLQSGSSGDSSSPKVSGQSPTQKVRKEVNKPVKRVTRSSAGSRRSSAGSLRSQLDDSDETMLHTIVYEKEFQQEVLDDSSELVESRRDSKVNVTILETPDGSEESDTEPQIPIKNKRSNKKT